MTANPDHVLVLVMAGLLFVGWDGFCLYDLARAKEARFLPKSVWAIITLISFPLGGILYLLIGRDWNRSDARLPGGRTPLGRDLSGSTAADSVGKCEACTCLADRGQAAASGLVRRSMSSMPRVRAARLVTCRGWWRPGWPSPGTRGGAS